MTPGGTDLMFVCSGKVDVLETTLKHFRQKWPKLVYETLPHECDQDEHFIYADQDTKDKIEIEGVTDELGPLFAHLVHHRAGQTVRHYIQEVTIVIDRLDESIYPTIETIQLEFLRSFMD